MSYREVPVVCYCLNSYLQWKKKQHWLIETWNTVTKSSFSLNITQVQCTHFNISHSLDRNSVAASQEQKELFLIFKWKLMKRFPEPPRQKKHKWLLSSIIIRIFAEIRLLLVKRPPPIITPSSDVIGLTSSGTSRTSPDHPPPPCGKPSNRSVFQHDLRYWTKINKSISWLKND